ncbi:MAG: hypothetical protein AAGE65_14435 [Planctomycetota bacterium]
MSLRLPAGRCALFMFVALALVATAPVVPQAPDSTDAQPSVESLAPAQQALDLDRLLSDPLVEDARLDDPVWQLDDVEGRSPLLIPIRITPGETPTELNNPAVLLGGARFVGWWVPQPESQESEVRRAGRSARASTANDPARPPRFVAGDSRFARLLGDPDADPTRGALDEPVVEELVIPAVPGPRLARSITIEPDDRLTWELDRSFQGASLNSGNQLYVLKLDPVRLRELRPDPAERLTRKNNETSAEFNLRRREAQQGARAEQQAFRELRASVQDLPDTFAVSLSDLPGRVAWAVFLKQDRRPELAFEGTTDGLPWTVGGEAFSTLRGMAGAGGARGGVGDGSVDPIAALDALASGGHPVSMRAVAVALAGGEGTPFRSMVAGDSIYQLAQKIVLGNEPHAARTVIDALAQVDPPTNTTRRLLDVAAQTDDPLAKLAALRASLRSSADNPDAVVRILQQAVAVLRDPAGPPPQQVLAALAGTEVEGSRRRGGALTNALPALTIGVPFESIPAERWPGAVRWVLEHADDPEGLAAAWLDVQLLGGDNDALIRETLRQLAVAEVVYPEDQTAPVVEDTGSSPTRALREMLFGRSNDGGPEASASPPPSSAPALAIAPLPLTSPDHGLFAALAHEDTGLRGQAWSVLPKFTVAVPRGRAEIGPILDAAVTAAPSPTPSTLLPFLQQALASDRATQAATSALMRLTVAADDNTSAQAVALLLGPDRDPDADSPPRRRGLSQAWQDLEPDARVSFTAAVYRGRLGTDTPVAALAADDRAGPWFVRQLDEGQVPGPGDWLEPLGGESQVIDLAGGEDDALAHGALAALAAAVGADAEAQRAVIERLGAAPRSADELQVAWPGVQRELIVGQLRDAAGDYRLVLIVTEGAPETEAAPGRGRPANRPRPRGGDDDASAEAEPRPIVPTSLVLGVVELTVDDTRVALVGDPVTLDVPETFTALRIADPLQLRNFPTPDLADLPLDQAAAPIDLRGDAEGNWIGRTAFGDAHTLEVRLEPAE